MEVTKTYPVNRIMHTRPTTEVAMLATRLSNKHRGLYLDCKNPKPPEEGAWVYVRCSDVEAMLENQIGSHGSVEIRATGDFPKDLLERCADQIGEVYGKITKETELPYVEHFGDGDSFP